MPSRRSVLTLPLPADFDLPCAVCSYGYFVLAPNRWNGRTQTLHTVLRGVVGQPVRIAVSQRRASNGRGGRLVIRCDGVASRNDASRLKRQAARILRLDEDLADFHRRHRAAKRAGFGRLIRSASFFEDIVKTITGCNVAWPNTVRMNALLCAKVGDDGFPTPAQLAAWTPARLKRACKVGYRAERIIRLARDVLDGRLDLDWFERADAPGDELFAALRSIHGIGPYAASNLCQLLGRYDRLAIDTETYRHFRQRYDVPTPRTSAGLRRLHDRIEKHYAKHAPYQFLAYWFELWGTYEEHFGDARAWSESPPVTAANMRD